MERLKRVRDTLSVKPTATLEIIRELDSIINEYSNKKRKVEDVWIFPLEIWLMILEWLPFYDKIRTVLAIRRKMPPRFLKYNIFDKLVIQRDKVQWLSVLAVIPNLSLVRTLVIKYAPKKVENMFLNIHYPNLECLKIHSDSGGIPLKNQRRFYSCPNLRKLYISTKFGWDVLQSIPTLRVLIMPRTYSQELLNRLDYIQICVNGLSRCSNLMSMDFHATEVRCIRDYALGYTINMKVCPNVKKLHAPNIEVCELVADYFPNIDVLCMRTSSLVATCTRIRFLWPRLNTLVIKLEDYVKSEWNRKVEAWPYKFLRICFMKGYLEIYEISEFYSIRYRSGPWVYYERRANNK